MKKILLIAALFISGTAICQTTATTTDGRKVNLKADGTYEYLKVEQQSTGECSKYITEKTDKMTGKTTKSSISLLVSDDGGKTGFAAFTMLSKKTIILSLTTAGGGSCMEKSPKINVLFTDGTRLEFHADNKFNCEQRATVYFLGGFGKDDEFEQLTTKDIATLRVATSKSFVQKDFTQKQATQFRGMLKCLAD